MEKVAEVGMTIKWNDVKHNVPLTGRVRKIYEKSVLVDLDESDYIELLDLNESTIVSHKRYAIINKEVLHQSEAGVAL